MSFAPLSNLYAAAARNVQSISQENVKPRVASPSGPDCIHTINRTPENEPDWDSPRDSVTKRRRHAVYMHRPPIWHPEPRLPKRGIPIVEDSVWSDAVDEDDDLWNPFCQSKSPHSQRRIHDPCLSDLEHNALDTSVGHISEEQTKFEQQLYCDTTAAMAEAQASDVDVPSDTTVPSPFRQPRKKNQSDPLGCASVYDSSSQITRQDSFRQRKAGLCTRLQSYKDIRLEVGEGWAIQEGSLVVCIDPSYTSFEHQKEHLSDEFEFVTGDFFIVCRLYADLWALCVKISFDSPGKNDAGRPSSEAFAHLGFLPLCAVTVAANFSSFVRRCSMYSNDHHIDESYPGNGLPVIPPERSHSLNASKQVFHGNQLDAEIPSLVYDACNTLSMEGIDMEFIPLDSTLQQLFSGIGGRRHRVHQLGKRMSLRSLWHGTRSSNSSNADRTSRSPSFRNLNSGSHSSQTAGQYQARRERWGSFSSTSSQIRKWFPSVLPRVQLQQGIRDFMLTSNRRRGHSWG